jgi:molecular chaperone DnaK
MPADLKSDLESKIADLRSALSTDDVSRIRSAREALEQTFYKASESIYQQGGASGADGNPNWEGASQGAGQGSTSRDDTIEGEYKEM